jgi:hypothetical protein
MLEHTMNRLIVIGLRQSTPMEGWSDRLAFAWQSPATPGFIQAVIAALFLWSTDIIANCV